MIAIYSLQWYIFIQVLAILAFIITFRLFSKLPDKGYCISKVLGITIPAYLSWIIMSLNIGTFKFSPVVSYLSAGLFAILAIVLFLKSYSTEERKEFFSFIDRHYKFIIFVEISFLVILILGAYIICFTPDILGIHRLLELTYIKSILTSNTLPPENLWFSGHKLNFYYFGYFIFSNQINLSFLEIHSAFNLIPSTILSLIVITAGGLLYNLSNSKTYGIIGGILAGFMANYVGLYTVLNTGLEKGFNWWDSAHILPNNEFSEFPFWSFVLGDIETYYIEHLIFLAFIYLLYVVIKENLIITPSKLSGKVISANALVVLCLSTMIMTNIYSIIFALLIAITTMTYSIINSKKKSEGVSSYFITIAIWFVLALLLCTPFFLSYNLTEIELARPLEATREFINSFFLLYGGFLIPIGIFILFELKNILKLNTLDSILLLIAFISFIELYWLYNSNVSVLIIALLAGAVLLGIAIFSMYKVYQSNNNQYFLSQAGSIAGIIIVLFLAYILLNNIVVVCMAGICIFCCYIISHKKDIREFYFVLTLLIACSILLIIATYPQFYLVEGGKGVLKSYIYVESQMLLPIILTMVIFYTASYLSNIKRDAFITIIALILLPCFIFTVLAPYYKTKKFKVIPDLVPNISGENHLRVFHNAEFNAIEWLRNHAKDDAVILEAYKPATAYSGRISGYAGKKTVIEAPENQVFIYGSSKSPEVNTRQEDVKAIYSEPDKKAVLNLIKKYNINYIYVGELENELYSNGNLEGFRDTGNLIFHYKDSSNKESKIYEVN